MDLLVDRKAQLEDSLKELEGTLSESKAEVSSEWLDAYARAGTVRKGSGWYSFTHALCRLPPKRFQRGGSQLVHRLINYCDQCGRILYRG